MAVVKDVRNKIREGEKHMKKPVLALFISACMGIGSTALLAQPQDQQNDPQQGNQQHYRHGPRGADPQQMVNRLSKRLKISTPTIMTMTSKTMMRM